MKPILHLPLKRQYFEEIRDGIKLEEYRLCNPYWAKRLEGREYEKIVLALGYPRRDAHELRITCTWNGYTLTSSPP